MNVATAAAGMAASPSEYLASEESGGLAAAIPAAVDIRVEADIRAEAATPAAADRAETIPTAARAETMDERSPSRRPS